MPGLNGMLPKIEGDAEVIARHIEDLIRTVSKAIILAQVCKSSGKMCLLRGQEDQVNRRYKTETTLQTYLPGGCKQGGLRYSYH